MIIKKLLPVQIDYHWSSIGQLRAGNTIAAHIKTKLRRKNFHSNAVAVFHFEYLGSGIFGVPVKQGPSAEQSKDASFTAGKMGKKSASSAALFLVVSTAVEITPICLRKSIID